MLRPYSHSSNLYIVCRLHSSFSYCNFIAVDSIVYFPAQLRVLVQVWQMWLGFIEFFWLRLILLLLIHQFFLFSHCHVFHHLWVVSKLLLSVIQHFHLLKHFRSQSQTLLKFSHHFLHLLNFLSQIILLLR
jgi:hypothetical protein